MLRLLRRLLSRLRRVRNDTPRGERGREGERLAAAYLVSRGFRILERNVRLPMGEADIVALDPDGFTRVVVEVKARERTPGQSRRSAESSPERNITAAKRRTLRAITHHLGAANHWPASRIDVIAVELRGDQAQVRHHPGAVRSSGPRFSGPRFR